MSRAAASAHQRWRTLHQLACWLDGPQYSPVTPEGRTLCVLPSFRSILVVSYPTAPLATFFVGHDVGAKGDTLCALDALRSEVAALRAELAGNQGGSRSKA